MKNQSEMPRPSVCPFLKQYGNAPSTCRLTNKIPDTTRFCHNQYSDGPVDFVGCAHYSLHYWEINPDEVASKVKRIFRNLPAPERSNEQGLVNEIVQDGRTDGAT
jgi:hypothetical protein